MISRKILRAASLILSCAAICAVLSGCGAKKTFSSVKSDGDPVGYRVTDSESGLVYTAYKGYAYLVTAGNKYAKVTSPDGERITLCEVEGALPENFLVSEDGSVIWSTLPMPTPSVCASDPDMSFSVTYSDGTDKIFSRDIKDTALTEAIASALDSGIYEPLPAHDLETYYLDFTFGGSYSGVTYRVGCVIDRDMYISYVYDRDRKRTVSVGTLLNGRLPYSLPSSAAVTESADSETRTSAE